MNTQPMPLEETMRLLSDLLNDVEYKHRYSVQKRDGAKSTLEQALYSNVADGQAEEMSILTSALHHLEAGKRDAERLDKIEAIGDFEGFRMTLSGKFSFVTSDVFVAPTLREAIDLALAEPTTEPQG